MLYLTKVEFQSRHIENYRLLGSPNRTYEIHQLVELLQKSPDAKERILWRLEEPHEGLPYVLAQSYFEPNGQRLVEQFGERIRFTTKAFKPDLKTGSNFRFRLRANVIRRSACDRDGVEERITHIRSVDDAMAWLNAKAQVGGFRINSCSWFREQLESFSAKGNRLTFASSRFEGLVEVEQPQLFEKVLRDGLGRGRAFGFGLFSVAPITTRRG